MAFLVHFSNTMSRKEYQNILDFMKNTLEYADIENGKVKVGAVVFRKRAVMLFDFNTFSTRDELFTGIDQINFNYRCVSVCFDLQCRYSKLKWV